MELQLAQARAEQATSLAQQLQQRADLLAVGGTGVGGLDGGVGWQLPAATASGLGGLSEG